MSIIGNCLNFLTALICKIATLGKSKLFFVSLKKWRKKIAIEVVFQNFKTHAKRIFLRFRKKNQDLIPCNNMT